MNKAVTSLIMSKNPEFSCSEMDHVLKNHLHLNELLNIAFVLGSKEGLEIHGGRGSNVVNIICPLLFEIGDLLKFGGAIALPLVPTVLRLIRQAS